MTDIAIEQVDFDYDDRETGLYRNLSVQFEQGASLVWSVSPVQENPP